MASSNPGSKSPTSDITDQGFGLVTLFKMPGNVVVQLYQPHYGKN